MKVGGGEGNGGGAPSGKITLGVQVGSGRSSSGRVISIVGVSVGFCPGSGRA